MPQATDTLAGGYDEVTVHYQLAPTPKIDDILAEVDRDPTSIFWG